VEEPEPPVEQAQLSSEVGPDHDDLGDGVYCSFDGWYIKLHTLNGDVIFLEPPVMAKLKEYEQRLIGKYTPEADRG
jgi:hypothetical protein